MHSSENRDVRDVGASTEVGGNRERNQIGRDRQWGNSGFRDHLMDGKS